MKAFMRKFDHRSDIYGTIRPEERVLAKQGKRTTRVRVTDIEIEKNVPESKLFSLRADILEGLCYAG